MSDAHPHGHAHGHARHQAHGDLTARAALFSVSVATLLLALKAYAAWTTGSVAMLGSLADTGLDVVASLITLYGVRLAAMPADREHRFGHGKAEAIAALFQVGIISFSAVGIGWRAGDPPLPRPAAPRARSRLLPSLIALAPALLL